MPTGVPTAARSVTPGPGRSSFDHPRHGRAAGHTATVPDLYAMGFRSVLTLEEGGHCCGVKFPLTFASLPSPVTFAR
ncbi:hypothetical protein Aau02nite_29850 [Amorphoplanes auranticolor]|uniref:Uncharacterized protein n=1 Tax=Actinoplanes auranticolor TaxID=47988 RepID=A0A919SAK7_9ACTN|nr:hypothetical protein Aau02nite_29850 [Actinoplanes auranticolor]